MSNTPNINKTFIIESQNEDSTITSCDKTFLNEIHACEDYNIDIYSDLTLVGDVEPLLDETQSIGTPTKRFREINSYSGKSTIWEATDKLTTNNLDLGLDDENNSRIITAKNSIIQDDILKGGTY